MAGTRIVLALLAVLAVVSLSCAAAADDGKVLTLDFTNFESEVKSHDFIAVMFYAPWCGHCKRLEPEYVKAAEMLVEEGSDIVLARINGDEKKHKAIARKYGVGGFPTIKIFRTDYASPLTYKGPREAVGLVAYLKKQAGPASTKVRSGSDLKRAMEDEAVVVVGLFSALSSPEFESFLSVARELRTDFVFKHTTDAALLPAKGPQLEAPAVRLLKQFDEGPSRTLPPKPLTPCASRQYFGLAVSDTPAMVIHDPRYDAKFIRTHIAPSDIAPFLADFQAGRAERVLKSEAVPQGDSGAVKKVVANSFKDLVLNSRKNVLVEFHAPWCTACADLDPVLNDVAESLSGQRDVVVAKMDFSANDIPSDKFDVTALPTIYLYTSAGVAVPYAGDNSKASLLAFVRKHKGAKKAAASPPTAEELAEAEEIANAEEDEDERKDELDPHCPFPVCPFRVCPLRVSLLCVCPSACAIISWRQVFLPGSSKTLHLYEARYLALLEEVRCTYNGTLRCVHGGEPWESHLQVGALVAVRGVGRIRLQQLTQVEPFLRGQVAVITDDRSEEGAGADGADSEVNKAVEELRAVLRDVQELQIKIKTSTDVPLQTPLERALRWVDTVTAASAAAPPPAPTAPGAPATSATAAAQQPAAASPQTLGDAPRTGAGTRVGADAGDAKSSSSGSSSGSGSTEASPSSWSILPDDDGVEPDQLPPEQLESAARFLGFQGLPTPATQSTVAVDPASVTVDPDFGKTARSSSSSSSESEGGGESEKAGGVEGRESRGALEGGGPVTAPEVPPYREYLPSYDELVTFAALQPVAGASAAELHGLLQKRLAAMEETDTMKRAALARQYAEQSRAALAAKVALQSLQL
ncbi:unnamed protein product [Closterium sp. NIES-53]